MRDKILEKFNIKEKDAKSIELFNHAYFQGLLVEIGHYKNLQPTCLLKTNTVCF